jgi:5-methylcytosine-specific restriction endonuclease McrA
MDAQNTTSPMPSSAGLLVSISTRKPPSKGSPVQLSTRKPVRTWADVPRNYPKIVLPDDRRDVRHRNYWDDEDLGVNRMDDADLSEQAEAWLQHYDEKEAGVVHCGNCGSPMHMSGSDIRFQMSCAYCGVKGPYDDTRAGARSLALALFPDEQ